MTAKKRCWFHSRAWGCRCDLEEGHEGGCCSAGDGFAGGWDPRKQSDPLKAPPAATKPTKQPTCVEDVRRFAEALAADPSSHRAGCSAWERKTGASLSLAPETLLKLCAEVERLQYEVSELRNRNSTP